VQPQGPLHGDLPVAKSSIGENLRFRALLEIQECGADAINIFWRKLAVFLAEEW
jgi:hypothetical protein